VARSTASQLQFPMMKVKRTCEVGLVVPCSSQKIPETAAATPPAESAIAKKLKPPTCVTLGNGHKLFGMNVLLFSIASMAYGGGVSQAERAELDSFRMVFADAGIRLGLSRRFSELAVFDALLYIGVRRIDEPA